MKIKIQGGTRKQKAIAHKFGKWCINKLFDPETAKSIQIKVVYGKSEMKRLASADDHAFMDWNANQTVVRSFQIYINPELTLKDLYLTIAHECVHIRQVATGWLVFTDEVDEEYRKLWKGRDYTKCKYETQPWEKEAYRLQEPLVKEYLLEQL